MKPSHNILLTFGINGSLRKREVQGVVPHTEHYLFNSAANFKAYSNNGLDFAYYGYNASNTRAYKLSMLNLNQWVNGQPGPLSLQLQSAMFYPNAYLNFNQNGEYTKHYYNGAERIASRLGSSTQPTDATSNDRLEYRMMREEEKFRENIQELVSDGQPVDFQGTVELNSLQPANATSDIFYYHTNHLGSTAYVTDQSQNITQGFLYAPFGEITTEYNSTFGGDIIPKYSFNAKELDEETGMYYYEARYYKPPVFTSRDPMFEKYFWMTPYAYCANNPVKYVDPDGNIPIPIHAQMVDKAFSMLSSKALKQLKFGTSKMADILFVFYSPVHMDNMRRTSSIVNRYNHAKSKFTKRMDKGHYRRAGISLHTVADFYAHSNYIDLYSKYADENKSSMNIADIPTFSDAMNDEKFMKFVEENGGLKTGAFPGWGKKSHKKMNKDSNDSFNGGSPYNKNNPAGSTKHEAARSVAEKDLNEMAK